MFNQSDGHPWGQRAIAQDSGGETATARRSHEWEEALKQRDKAENCRGRLARHHANP